MDFNGNCDDVMFSTSTTTPPPTPDPTASNHTHTLSIEIKATDEIIALPDPDTTIYDFIQYKKNMDTARDIIFHYNNLQLAKMYHHRKQTVVFHKFKPLGGLVSYWIT
jgi:hypothetical protein